MNRLTTAILHAGRFVVCGAMVSVVSCSAANADTGQEYLLLDSRVVESAEGAELVLGEAEKCPHNPLFGADRPWEVRMDNLYPNVVYDQSTKKFHCWYSPFIVDPATSNTPAEQRTDITYLDRLKQIGSQKREIAVCYATSVDGVRWNKPELGLYDFEGSKQNNLVLRLHAQGPHGAGVLFDEFEQVPARRFKAFFSFDRGLRLTYSADGIRWSDPIDCDGIEVPGDTHNCLLWAPTIGKYVGFTRTWDGVRQAARTQSVDLQEWTAAKVVLQGLDEHHQTYAMQVFPYSGIYLGLLMILDVEADTVRCELAWSPDTQQWHRVCAGEALIENGPNGSYDWGCVYASSPVIVNERIRLYYGGGNGRHGDWRDSFLCCADLPLDRWAGYRPKVVGVSASVVTRPLLLTSGQLELSADAEGGSIRLSLIDEDSEALAESMPISTNITRGKVTWKRPESIAKLIGKRVRLRFELNDATIYAFRIRRKP